MIYLPTILLCSAIGATSASGQLETGALHQTVAIKRSVQVKYALYLPDGYGSDTKKRWPVVLMLHGKGECGNDPKLLLDRQPITYAKQTPGFGFVIIAPQCPVDDTWSGMAETRYNLPSIPLSPTCALLGLPPRAMTAQFSNSNGGSTRNFSSVHGKSRTTNPRPLRQRLSSSRTRS